MIPYGNVFLTQKSYMCIEKICGVDEKKKKYQLYQCINYGDCVLTSRKVQNNNNNNNFLKYILLF